MRPIGGVSRKLRQMPVLPGIEQLENRFMLSGGADLAVAFGKLVVPSVLVPGDKLRVPVVVTNVGSAAAIGQMDANLLASGDQTVGDDTVLGQLKALRVKLAPGKSATFSFSVTLTSAMNPGVRYLLAQIVPGAAISDADAGNDLAVWGPGELAWKFGNVGARKNVRLTLTEGDGTTAVLSLSGLGTGEVVPGPQGWDLHLTGTDVKSSVTITTTKSKQPGDDGQIVLNDIVVGDAGNPASADSLLSLTAKTADLRGDLTVAGLGTLGSLTLNDVVGTQSTLSIGGSGGAGVSLSFGRVGDLGIQSGMPIKSLQAVEWKDPGGDDVIRAPWLARLTITGRKGVVAGDFQAGLVLNQDGLSTAKLTLGAARIAGDLRDTHWEITGDAGSVAVAGVVDQWYLQLNSSIKTLSLGDVGAAFLKVDDVAGSIKALRWSGGRIEAGSVGSLEVRGNKQVAGDLGAELDLGALGSGNILGAITGPATIHGDAKNLKLGALRADLEIGGNAGLKIGHPLAVVSDRPGVTSGMLHVGGAAKVQGGSGTYRFTNATLYSATADLYRPMELLHYDVLGAGWDYNALLRTACGPEETTASEEVLDQTEIIKGRKCTIVKTIEDSNPALYTAWYTDETGTYIVRVSQHLGQLGSLDLLLDMPRIFPPYLRLGVKYTSKGPVSGQMEKDVNGVHFHVSMQGTATFTSQLLGHEQVTVPTGTYLAARIELRMLISTTIVVEADGKTYRGTLSGSETQNWWCVPEIGSGSIAGEGLANRNSSNWELVRYHLA